VATLDSPQLHRSHAREYWLAVVRYVQAVTLVGMTFVLILVVLGNGRHMVFILLPIGVSIASGLILGHVSLRQPRALLCTLAVTTIYFGGITVLELATHSRVTEKIILVTTTLTLAVIFSPVRDLLQDFLEQHFHLRENATSRAVAAFTSAMREEIDLDGVRERFLDIAQQTMLPYSVAVWVRAEAHEDSPSALQASQFAADQQPGALPPRSQWHRSYTHVPSSVLGTEISTETLDESDPLVTYLLEHSGVQELDRLRLASPALERLQASDVELVLPLVGDGELLGLLVLGPRMGSQRDHIRLSGMITIRLLNLLLVGPEWQRRIYSREDRTLLDMLATQMAPAVRMAQLVRAQQAQIRAHDRIEQELRTAQQIQRMFLPKEAPTPPGWQLVPYYEPAREVGGDFYDFHTFADGRLGLVLGDVTGKGIPAALMMTATRTMLRTAAQENATPPDILGRVNDLLCADTPPGMFVTCFYALLEPRSGRLCFANAGQDLPYLRRATGDVHELRARGMPLGLMAGSRYEESETLLARGDSLLFYSDGIVEAHNMQREMFGAERLAGVVEQQSGAPTLIAALLSTLATFTGADWEQEDDVTLLLLQRLQQVEDDG
jgi:serine phosphatase RsbU (regulator of sigma subunit)